jgi:hypothetical protein
VLKLVVLITLIIIILTVNPYLIPQVDSSLASSSPSLDDDNGGNKDNDNNGSEPQDNSPQDDSQGTDSSSDGVEPTGGGTEAPSDGVEPTGEVGGGSEGEVGPVPPGDDQEEAEETKVCVTNKEGVKFCFETLPPDELPCPEPIVVEDTELVCLPPREGIDTSNITTAATSELINQTGLINNNNATDGEMIIKEEGTSSPCIIIKEEGTPSGPNYPQPQPSPSPNPC